MRTELYIDGKWVKGTSTNPVYDPADGSVIADVHLANDELCDAVFLSDAKKPGPTCKPIA